MSSVDRNDLREKEYCLFVKKMRNVKPVKCQKCGKPIGFVTVLGRGLTPFQQPVPNVKIVAICMECAQEKK
jgi:hypothetical protein